MTVNLKFKFKFNVLMIPEKRGKKRHPKIWIQSYKAFNGYAININCGPILYTFMTENEEEGINEALEIIPLELEDYRKRQKKNRKRIQDEEN